MPMISPVATRIGDILNASTQYAIPRYQRDFKWGETEAQELVEDLNNYRGQDREHLFLGNFIFEATRDQKTYVIDGQQRLTSIVLLLIACRMHARNLNWPQLESTIQQRITFVDPTTAQSEGCRFLASESIRDLFEYMAGEQWEGDFPSRMDQKQIRRQVNRVRPVYQFFFDEVSRLSKDELSQFLRAIYDSYVIRISIANEEEALSIFERTNARGMDLEIADLLKNYLFAQRVANIDERWNEILSNSEGTILRMLKYFYVSNSGYVSKPQLYRKLKALGDELGADALTEELAEFSRFYSLTKAPSKERTQEYFEEIGLEAVSTRQDRLEAITASLQALLEFGVVQFCPVAYAAVRMARRSPKESSDANARAIVRLIGALEKYHFVNNVVCERVGNEVERLYADTCQSLAEASDLPSATDALVTELRKKRAGPDEFQSRFVEISYSSASLGAICYIFDRISNHGIDPSQRLPIFIPDRRLLRRSNNIEHFLPQRPPDDFPVDDETRGNINNIGNLLPIYFRTNSRLGNLAPPEKVVQLSGPLRKEIQNLPFVQDFLEQYGQEAEHWNAESIRRRAGDLAALAYEKVWAL